MLKTVVPLSAALLFAACGNDSSASPKPEGGAVASPKLVRMSAIPDFNKAEMAEWNKKLAAYLQKETGVEFRFDPSSDYTAAVNGMVAGQLDLVWFGGVTSVQVSEQVPGKIEFVACRDIDQKFKSYFIANKAAIDAGKIHAVDKVADLKPMLAHCNFAFGSKSSTSGHVMPRHFLLDAGIDPESDFAGKPSFLGTHSAVMTAVSNGTVDAGVVNYSGYDAKSAEEKAKMPIICTTPDFVDYCFVAHDRLGKDLIAKIRAALVKLSSSDPEQAQILKVWGAGKFVAANAKDWDGIRAVLKSLPTGFLETK